MGEGKPEPSTTPKEQYARQPPGSQEQGCGSEDLQVQSDNVLFNCLPAK